MAMVPHERSLVERLKDKPFVLLGVDCDPEVKEGRKAASAHDMNWRSLSSDSSAMNKYGVSALPTLFLIDARGIIRESWVGAPSNQTLEQAIDKLVAEAEKQPGGKGS